VNDASAKCRELKWRVLVMTDARSGQFVRVLFAIVVLLLVAVNIVHLQRVAAQVPGPAAAANADALPGKLIVDGTVVDESGVPVGGATVSAMPQLVGESSATTDEAGKFRMQLSVRPLTQRQIKAESKDGTLGIASWDHRALKITLKLPRELPVSVVDAHGRPVRGAAAVLLTGGSQGLPAEAASGETDAGGRWIARFPADTVVDQVAALKGGVGFDHFSTLQEPRGVERRPLPDRLELKLDGARTVRVKAVDVMGQPLAQVNIRPFRLLMHEHSDAIRVSEWKPAQRLTDASGIAVFDWLPPKSANSISFFANAIGYRSRNFSTSIAQGAPKDSGADILIELIRLSTISGRVTFADGHPAVGIRIVANGFTGRGGTGGEVFSNSDGTYQVNASPDAVYVVHVEDRRFAAASQVGVMVAESQETSDVNFILTAGTIVRGKVTVGPKHDAVPNFSLFLLTRYGDVPAALRPKQGPVPQMLSASSAATSADGSFRFCVVPGTYELGGGGGILKPVILNVVEGRDVVHDIHMPRIPKDPGNARAMATIVDSEQRPVGGALISGAPRSPVFKYSGYTIARPDGRFEFISTLIPLVVHARTPDGLSAGIARIENTEKEPVIPLGEAATAHGKLLDDEGRAAGERRLRYGIVVREDDANKSLATQTLVVDTVTTGPDGQFELRGIVPGEEFVLEFEAEYKSDQWQTLTTVKAVQPEAFDVGDLRLPAVE
jgi:hypothetical protein